MGRNEIKQPKIFPILILIKKIKFGRRDYLFFIIFYQLINWFFIFEISYPAGRRIAGELRLNERFAERAGSERAGSAEPGIDRSACMAGGAPMARHGHWRRHGRGHRARDLARQPSLRLA